MRWLALGWLAGAAWLQSQAGLPAQMICTGLLLLCVALISISFLCRPVLLLCAGLAMGIGWSGLLAHNRLAEVLPEALEGKDLRVSGIIASLPDQLERGQRFVFEVEHAEYQGQLLVLPRRLAIGWYEQEGDTQQQYGQQRDSQQSSQQSSEQSSQNITQPSSQPSNQYRSQRSTQAQVLPGQRWQFTLRLRRPHGNANPEGFDYEAWLLTENLRATGYVRPGETKKLQDFVFSVRDSIGLMRAQLRQRLRTALPEAEGWPYASVILALVIGDQRGVSQSDWDIFNRTGIGHLVSISGLHITMIAALMAAVFHFLWRHSFFTQASLPLLLPTQKIAAMAGLLTALIYVALAGFGIPAQRTLLMIAVVTLALWTGRLTAVSQVLSFALMAVLLLDPWAVLWPGFWLSFAAIACILFATAGRVDEPLIDGTHEVHQVHESYAADEEHEDLTSKHSAALNWFAACKRSLRAATRTQYAVTLGLLPLSMALFAQVSLIGPIANAIAIPVVSLLITPLSLLGSVAPAPFSVWLLQLAHTLLSWLVNWLSWLSHLPLAVWQAPQASTAHLLMALAGTLWLLAPRGWPLRWAGALAWFPMLLARPAAPVSGLWITAFDIGQGNAVLIETAQHRLLYDTGPAFSAESDSANRVLLPYFRTRGISSLDGLMVSHSDMDHSGGARSLLEAMDVGWFSSSLPSTHALVRASGRHVSCVAGQRWNWDGVSFEILHPLSQHEAESKPNALSCTLRITAGKFSVLLAGDIEAPQERALMERVPEKLRANVLLVPHHGSGTSSTVAFLDQVAPEIALFQVGYRNRYHHPKAEVMQRYVSRGVRTLRSDVSGAVMISIDTELRLITQACEHKRYWASQRCIE